MNILVLSTADWEHPIWTNKQHVAIALADLGHRVIYLDSLGIRKVTTSAKDKQRVLRRIRDIIRSPRKIRQRLWSVSPLVIPGIQKGLLKSLNRRLINLTIYFTCLKLGFKCDTLWTYNPATTIYLNPESFKRSLYHCVDDIGSQPNMPKDTISSLERELAKKVNLVIATTPNLRNKLEVFSKQIHMMPNVVEYEHFALPSSESKKKGEEIIKAINHPIIGFVGAISNYKIDFKLLSYLAEKNKEYSFVLIGPIGEGEFETNISDLKSKANIHFIEAQDYENIPGIISNFDVGIIPSRRNKYTESMFPMKFFEYLASGIPVVAKEIPALKPYKTKARLCNDAESFSKQIQLALLNDNIQEKKKERQSLAKENTYEIRTKNMLDLLQQ